MEVDRKLLEHVAQVARLKLSEAEIKEFLPQLKEVLNAFSKISDVNTGSLEPSFQPVVLKDALRDDSVKEGISQEEALSNSAHTKDGYFKGPRAV